MEENKELKTNTSQLTFQKLFREIESKFSGMPSDSLYSALTRTGAYRGLANMQDLMMTANPYIQNDRVKAITSLPREYGKNKLVEMLLNPSANEKPLREISNALTYTAYPYFKLIKTYADILTYRHYTYPADLDVVSSDAEKKSLMREWRLVEKISRYIDPEQTAHQIAMHCGREGKGFYIIRKSLDRPHNNVNYCFLQQLPEDWCKIVGFNNITKYTVAFNMMYFLEEGTDPLQFGDLFVPYLEDLGGFVDDRKRVKYSSLKKQDIGKMRGNPNVYYQNGKWFWWVTLPAETVWTFECDDSDRNVVPPLTGLMLSMAQIAQYENLQLELLANPLVSVVLGEMEYADTNGMTAMEDAYKLSPSGRAFFEALWYQMLAQNNTSGIGFFAAPLKNMRLEQLAEAPSATEISSKGYSYTIMKSGSGIVNATTEPRVGMVEISAKIESQFMRCVYRTFESMMNWIYSTIGLKHEWRFVMFGDIFSEQRDLEDARAGMSLGILMDTLKYDALRGHSVLDDLSIGNAVIGVEVLEKRIPLKTSYTQSSEDTGIGSAQSINRTAGRPSIESEEITEEGTEESKDSE